MTKDCASSSSTHAPPLPTLPFDLVAEILCLLPVKHLIKLRRVCKSWNSLISDDSKFAKKHFRLSTSNHDRHHLTLTPTRISHEFVLSDLPLSTIFSREEFVSTPRVTTIRYPPFPNNIGYNYCGRPSTYHGIFCFGINESFAVLCNPSIGKSKILPPLELETRTNLKTFYTLVYDRFTDNHKIIALSKCPGYQEVNVHTLGTYNWKRIQNIPSQCILFEPGIFVCDTVNWLAYDTCSYLWLIVSFHLEKDSCRTLLQPLHDNLFSPKRVLGELRGCLSILSHPSKFYDVWIMKEYGNEQSWNKLLSVPKMGGYPCFRGAYTKILYISEDDQVLLQFMKIREYGLVVYDPRNYTFKTLEIQNISGWMEPNIYVESLISPLS